MNAFEDLIYRLPRNASVLDVGSGGLGGENTTNFLLKHFNDITGIDVHPRVKKYAADKLMTMLQGDFYSYNFDKTFDIIIHDLDIDENMEDWENEFARARELLNPKGYLVVYFMITDHYGGYDALIRKHWSIFWGGWPPLEDKIEEKIRALKYFDYISRRREERRPYIVWTLLQKK